MPESRYEERSVVALWQFRRAKCEPGSTAYFDPAMYRFTQDTIDLDELRARLRKLTDAELIAFGKSVRYMCSPAANLDKPPREPFVIQLREAREEWMRRNGSAERID